MKQKLVALTLLIIGAVAVAFKLNSNLAEAAAEIEEELQPVDVQLDTMVLTTTRLKDQFIVIGTTEPRTVVTVIAETDGKVMMSDLETGSSVTRGQTLVKLDTDIKQANHQVNVVTYQKAKQDHQRLSDLHKDGNASQAEVDNALLQLQTAEQQVAISAKTLEQSIIKSPLTGVVTEKKVHTGDFAMTGNPVATIAQLEPPLVKAYLTQEQAFRVVPGQTVDVTLDQFPNRRFKGKVTALVPVATQAKTYPIEITLDKPASERLMSGMIASINFGARAEAEVLLAPRTSLVMKGGIAYVYVIKGKEVRRTPVQTGRDIGTMTEITHGVGAGETIVTRGQQMLENEARIGNYTVITAPN